jgi:hypothetical protein
MEQQNMFEKRLRNQLRIHWRWLKDLNDKELADFIIALYKKWNNEIIST